MRTPLFVYFNINTTKTTISINQTSSVIADSITQTVGYSFILPVNITNDGPMEAYDVNLTINDSSGGVLAYNVTSTSFGTINASESRLWTVNVTIPNATAPQVINITTNATWRNPDLSY